MAPALSTTLSQAVPVSIALSTAALSLSLLYFYTRPSPSLRTQKSIPSPLTTLLPSLSPSEVAELPYPPDIFPGARDVDTPYGSLRVYEWGPEEGRKGIAGAWDQYAVSKSWRGRGGLSGKGMSGHFVWYVAPRALWGRLWHFFGLLRASLLVLGDLWGRGYSDAPTSLPHDTRLYTTAILTALASSPLSWTGGSSTFSLIGYSLGSGIVVGFASYFPTLVSSLILLAPAGLIRDSHFSTTNKLLFNAGILPDRLVESMIRRRLQDGPSGATAVKPKEVENGKMNGVGEVVTAELPEKEGENGEKAGSGFDGAVLSKNRPGVTVKDAVAWQARTHAGFVKSFLSSVRHGPISNQHADWRRIGDRLTIQNAPFSQAASTSIPAYESTSLGLDGGKVLIICGRSDPVIDYRELVEDATEVLGKGNVVIESCDSGHELPITKSVEIVEFIWEFWEKE